MNIVACRLEANRRSRLLRRVRSRGYKRGFNIFRTQNGFFDRQFQRDWGDVLEVRKAAKGKVA